MLLEVPFYTQGLNECGPVALQMVLEFFGEKHEKEKIKSLVSSETGGATWTIGLAKAAGELGFKTEFYTKTLGMNQENFNLAFYKKQTGGARSAEEKLGFLVASCKKFNVSLQEKSLSLSDLLEKISPDCIAIVLLDWHKITKREGYQGHIVPIVGYDESHVFIHQPGPADATAKQPILKEVFDAARKAKGTDEDILFIHRK